jgi:hypothetical protein
MSVRLAIEKSKLLMPSARRNGLTRGSLPNWNGPGSV